jgi:endonuclease/exonuclease/phosphatase (EEP) superfamily protein YafD
MAVSWNKDIDSALSQAKSQHKPVLVDFSAAPA